MGHQSKGQLPYSRMPWEQQVDRGSTGGQGVEYDIQHPTDVFVSQFSTHPRARWLHDYDMFTPFSVKS